MDRITPTASPALFRLSQEGRRASPAVVRLVIFGYTGGTVTALQSLFSKVPSWAEVWGAEYPGRGLRWKEPLKDSLGSLLDEFEAALTASSELPLVLFGYSFGALVAFALAQRFSSRKRPVIGLIAMSAKAPRHAESRRQTRTYDDEQLMADLRALGGIPDEVWSRPAFLEMVLSVIRADLSCYDAFSRDETIGIGCPVMALHGSADPLIAKVQMGDWLNEADGVPGLSEFHSLDGSHFLHCEQESALQALMAEWLQKLLRSTGISPECKASERMCGDTEQLNTSRKSESDESSQAITILL